MAASHEPRNTVIVTGFGPFGNHNVNASWEAVHLLHTTGIDKEMDICLITEEIPVSYNYVKTNVPELWNKNNPLLVIHVGFHENVQNVRLERAAQKHHYELLDICGHRPMSDVKECCTRSPCLIRSTLDLKELSQKMKYSNNIIHTETSEDACRYVCEYIYYTSLSIDKTRTIFIHVPPLDRPYSAEQLARGLSDIMRCLVQQLRMEKAISL